MSHELRGAFARRIGRAYERIVYDLQVSQTQTWITRAAAAAPIGSTAVSLTTLPAGFDRVKAGDYATFGGTTVKTFSGETVAVGGTITNAPFSPATTSAVAANVQINVSRTTLYTVRGYTRQYGASELLGNIVLGDGEAVILATSLPAGFEFKANDRVFDRFGSQGSIKQARYDAELALWKLQVGGW